MLHYKKLLLLSLLLLLIVFTCPGQHIAAVQEPETFSGGSSVQVNVFFNCGIWRDSIVHMVWENHDANNIAQVFVESSYDGNNFSVISGATIANLIDIHLYNYPKEIDYNKQVLMSSEHGNIRFIYNDVIMDPVAIHSRWYRIRMVTFTGATYISQVIHSDDDGQKVITTNSNPIIIDNTPEDIKALHKGVKVACPSIGTPPSGYIATAQTQSFFGDCCQWEERLYQGTGPIYTTCSGSSYAWCCNNVPGASSCPTSYISDPCCVHYCDEYGSCSCTPWECCTSSTVTEWVVISSTSYNAISLTSNVQNETCAGQNDGSITLTVSNASNPVTFNWSSGQTTQNLTGLASGSYSVTVTDANNCQATGSYTVTTSPVPTVTVPANIVVCNGAIIPATNFVSTPAGGTFSWTNSNTSIGLTGSGTGDVPSFTAINNGVFTTYSTITVTATVANCVSAPTPYTIAINPIPTVNVPSNITLCNNAAVPAITFTSPTPGATYAWTNSNPAIGLAVSGVGDIASFTATNTGTSPITATITVTPTANNCPGTASSFTITVNPTPTVVVPADVVICNGFVVPGTSFTSPTAGATYAWTNSNPAIGLAASGVGNIAAFTATDTGSSPITATITVTPTANTCTGTASTYTITVNPSPIVVVPADITVCPMNTIPATAFTSTTSGATYSWTNSNTAIGLAGSGMGDIPAFTSTNTGTTPLTSTITVTPSANNCTGIPSTYQITVNALPVLQFNPLPLICPSSPILPLTQATPAGGTYYGPGVTNDSLDPAIAGVGTHVIKYIYTDPGTTCTDSITQTITIDPGIFISVDPSFMTICPEDNITITASGANYFYSWAPPLGINVTSGPVVVADPPTSIIYTVTGTNDNGCSGSTTSTINLYNTSLVDIVAVPPWGCNPVNVALSYSPENIINDSTCHWDFGDFYSNDNTSSEKFPSHFYQHEGNYVVLFTAEDINGCHVEDYIPVDVYISPHADFYYTPLTAWTDDPLVNFVDLSMGANFWSWNFGDPASYSENTSDLQNPYHIFSDSGDYMVQLIVTSSHNCSDTTEKPLTIKPQVVIYVPNAFTPDNDIWNDIWKPVITGIDKDNYSLYIFDRWGREQFYTTDYEQGWDGKNKGKNCELGVYLYLINYQNLAGKEFKLKGIVTLVR